MTRAALIAVLLLTACTNAADRTDIPAKYDHPFAGRKIVESLSPEEVAVRCGNAWDVKWWQIAKACNWTFPDPLNPGKLAAHFIYPRWKDVGTDRLVFLIRLETAKANGWDAVR